MTDGTRLDLRGRTAIVTGAATGIGAAIAVRLGACGANVVVDYRGDTEAAGAQDVVAQVRARGGDGVAIAADVTSEADVARLIAAAAPFGGLDVLVNNAGIEERAAAVDTTLAMWERTLRVNLTGAFLCSREAARAMIARGRGGRIVNVSSVHEDLAMPNNAAYAASTGGVRTFMRTLALELAPHGITVNDVAPGAIATPINAAVRDDPVSGPQLLAEIPLGRVGTPDDVAGVVAFLASDLAAYVTGATYVVDGGLSRFTRGL